MATIQDLVTDIQTFLPFRDVLDLILTFGTNMKSKLWTVEILTKNLNEIITQFLDSHFQTIDLFFKEFIFKRFAQDPKKIQKYCLTLMLSLLTYKERFSYLQLYFELFNEAPDVEIYYFFSEARRLSLNLKQISDQNFKNLDEVYMSAKQWQIVLNQTLDYGVQEIKLFETDLQQIVHKVRHERVEKIGKFMRNGEYNLSFFLREALTRFMEIHRAANDNREADLENYRNKVVRKFEGRYNDLVKRLSKGRVTRVFNPQIESQMEDEVDLNELKLLEKKRLTEEIKNVARRVNRYRLSGAKLLAYLKEIDPIYLEIRKKINELREQFLKIKRERPGTKPLDDVYADASVVMMALLEKGSRLVSKNSLELRSMLLTTDPEIQKGILEREHDVKPGIRKLIKDLRQTIFSDRFSLTVNRDARNLDRLRSELEKIFSRFKQLENSDYLLLEAFFQNGQGNVQNEISSENVLGNVTSKLIDLINSGLGNEKDGNADEHERNNTIIEEISSSLEKYNSIDESQIQEIERIKALSGQEDELPRGGSNLSAKITESRKSQQRNSQALSEKSKQKDSGADFFFNNPNTDSLMSQKDENNVDIFEQKDNVFDSAVKSEDQDKYIERINSEALMTEQQRNELRRAEAEKGLDFLNPQKNSDELLDFGSFRVVEKQSRQFGQSLGGNHGDAPQTAFVKKRQPKMDENSPQNFDDQEPRSSGYNQSNFNLRESKNKEGSNPSPFANNNLSDSKKMSDPIGKSERLSSMHNKIQEEQNSGVFGQQKASFYNENNDNLIYSQKRKNDDNNDIVSDLNKEWSADDNIEAAPDNSKLDSYNSSNFNSQADNAKIPSDQNFLGFGGENNRNSADQRKPSTSNRASANNGYFKDDVDEIANENDPYSQKKTSNRNGSSTNNGYFKDDVDEIENDPYSQRKSAQNQNSRFSNAFNNEDDDKRESKRGSNLNNTPNRFSNAFNNEDDNKKESKRGSNLNNTPNRFGDAFDAEAIDRRENKRGSNLNNTPNRFSNAFGDEDDDRRQSKKESNLDNTPNRFSNAFGDEDDDRRESKRGSDLNNAQGRRSPDFRKGQSESPDRSYSPNNHNDSLKQDVLTFNPKNSNDQIWDEKQLNANKNSLKNSLGHKTLSFDNKNPYFDSKDYGETNYNNGSKASNGKPQIDRNPFEQRSDETFKDSKPSSEPELNNISRSKKSGQPYDQADKDLFNFNDSLMDQNPQPKYSNQTSETYFADEAHKQSQQANLSNSAKNNNVPVFASFAGKNSKASDKQDAPNRGSQVQRQSSHASRFSNPEQPGNNSQADFRNSQGNRPSKILLSSNHGEPEIIPDFDSNDSNTVPQIRHKANLRNMDSAKSEAEEFTNTSIPSNLNSLQRSNLKNSLAKSSALQKSDPNFSKTSSLSKVKESNLDEIAEPKTKVNLRNIDSRGSTSGISPEEQLSFMNSLVERQSPRRTLGATALSSLENYDYFRENLEKDLEGVPSKSNSNSNYTDTLIKSNYKFSKNSLPIQELIANTERIDESSNEDILSNLNEINNEGQENDKAKEKNPSQNSDRRKVPSNFMQKEDSTAHALRSIKRKKGQAVSQETGLGGTDNKSVKNFFKGFFGKRQD